MEKRKLTSWEVVLHGVHHPDNWPGFGTGGTGFSDVETGIGASSQAALRDALDNISNLFEVPINTICQMMEHVSGSLEPVTEGTWFHLSVLFNREHWLTKSYERRLSFVRYSHLKIVVSQGVVIKLDSEDEPNPRLFLHRLQQAVTWWVNETEIGWLGYQATKGTLGIGDIVQSWPHIATSLTPYLTRFGIKALEFVDAPAFDLENEFAYDTPLVTETFNPPGGRKPQ
jgi:hypothetical protein